MPPVHPEISVVIPTHNPDEARLAATLEGLRRQTLPAEKWETLLVDNASSPGMAPAHLPAGRPPNLRVIDEPQLGLSHARRRGFAEARGEFAVLVDDDNVLDPEYLANVIRRFAEYPRVGALGGKSLPEFAVTPPDWTTEFHSLLALRHLGEIPLISLGLRAADSSRNAYPAFAPIGAGMALRRGAWSAWLDPARAKNPALTDRRGDALTSGGDNDIVLCAMQAGWEVAYFPELRLNHLIPASRLEADYLARLNRGIQQSWICVLSLHDACPWPPITRAGATLRKLKAWFTYRAWSSSAARIRWQGACGHFDGRAAPRIEA